MNTTNVASQFSEQRPPVQAPLNYLAKMAEKPYSYTYTPPPGMAQTNRRIARQTVAIHDARAVADRLSLDREGFALTQCESAVSNFYDEDEVRAGAGVALGGVRRAEPPAGRFRRQRPDLPASPGRDLRGDVQPQPPLVLRPGHAARRSAAAEMLR